MFSSTAYEAYYTYLGLYLHEASINIITSQEVLIALMMLILGITFLLSTWRYFGKYMPGFLGRGKSVHATFVFKILACFLISVSLLKVDSSMGVKNYERRSWHNNPYIHSKIGNGQDRYHVSFVFDLLTSSAEEIAAFATSIVDKLFQKTNSELQAPSAFYKAILYAGSQTIDDPSLRDKIDVYTDSCFEHILPLLATAKAQDRIDELFNANGGVDAELKVIPIQMEDGSTMSCLDLKNEVRKHLWEYSKDKGAKFNKHYANKYGINSYEVKEIDQRNLIASNALVNHYLNKTEDALGTQEGAKVEGTLAKFLLGWSRFWSFDGFLNLIGQKDQVGAVLTAQRAEKFSEYLQRAPHLKGLVKLFLIAIFPWLVFFIIAGRWKILISWFAVYVSVLLWTPIWCLLYHLMTSIALSNELMQEFGRVSDGVSLYSASFITAKLYQFYAIYSWLQLILGPLPTLILGYGLFSSFIKDSEGESAPTVVTAAKDVGMSAATGGVSSAATAVVRKI
jgi:hypothetical protein